MRESKQVEYRTTTCPFCLYGCELAIVSDTNHYYHRVEYVKEGRVNQGRLCPRGNAAAIILKHKNRLAYPLLNNKEISWQEALDQINSYLKSYQPDEIALTFDRNLTQEELDALIGLVNKLGIENFASSYLEPEIYFSYTVEDCPKATLSELESAQVFILIGDVFGLVSVIAKPILSARYANRNHRIFVIDSIATRAAGFADIFLHCRPNTEPLVLLAISSLLAGKIKGLEPETIANISGIELAKLEAVAESITKLDNGVILAATNFGRIDNPYLFSLAAQTLTIKAGAGKKFLGLGETNNGLGKVGFGSIYNNLSTGKTKVLLNLGEAFPFDYPQIAGDLNKLDGLITTAVFRPKNSCPGIILPVASNLEKNGTIHTLWGKTKINKTLKPLNGSKPIITIVELLKSISNEGKPTTHQEPRNPFVSVSMREVYEQARESLESALRPTEILEKNALLLMGEKPAIGFMNYFDNENIIKINPADAQNLKLKENQSVVVASEKYQSELIVKTTNQVPSGVALVGVNRIENRRLFTFTIDTATNNIIFPPTLIRIWQT